MCNGPGLLRATVSDYLKGKVGFKASFCSHDRSDSWVAAEQTKWWSLILKQNQPHKQNWINSNLTLLSLTLKWLCCSGTLKSGRLAASVATLDKPRTIDSNGEVIPPHKSIFPKTSATVYKVKASSKYFETEDNVVVPSPATNGPPAATDLEESNTGPNDIQVRVVVCLVGWWNVDFEVFILTRSQRSHQLEPMVSFQFVLCKSIFEKRIEW